jgi:hypothetical protein
MRRSYADPSLERNATNGPQTSRTVRARVCCHYVLGPCINERRMRALPVSLAWLCSRLRCRSSLPRDSVRSVS